VSLVELEIVLQEVYADGMAFGAIGSYEHIRALAHYAIDPLDPDNEGITDLDKAVTDQSGLVHFSGDVDMLLPLNRERGNGTVWFNVPNRGNYPYADGGEKGWLEKGWSFVSCGWQWDVPRSSQRIGLEAPEVAKEYIDAGDQMQLRLQPARSSPSIPLTDQHVGDIGNHVPIRPAQLDDKQATLLVREGIYGDAEEIPRHHWQFATDIDGKPEPNPDAIWLDGGFEAGRTYDVLFHPANCPVVGTGMLAIRDLALFIQGQDAIEQLSLKAERVIAEGSSQCGRLLRTYLQLGLNRAKGRQVFDGMLILVAGGRRGEFNHRYGQPSVQPTPGFGHLFPFADLPQYDPHTSELSGLLDLQRERGSLPKIIYLDSSSEYWRGDGSLTHTRADTGEDVDLPDCARRYVMASAPHHNGAARIDEESVFGSRGTNYLNTINRVALFKGAMTNLETWLLGVEPPGSVYPRWQDGTAATRESVMARLSEIAPIHLPRRDLLPTIRPLDLGSRGDDGVGRFPALPVGQSYPCCVSNIDSHGNEIGGIRLPVIEVPLAVHTGFNPRHHDCGGEGQLLEYLGSCVPFSREKFATLYASREDYQMKVQAAANTLALNRYILAEDADMCVQDALSIYDQISLIHNPGS
jgi:hypothetical protein